MQETKTIFEKLHKYIGKNIRHLVERSDEDYVLRLHKNRIYYVRESLMRRATNVMALPCTRHLFDCSPVCYSPISSHQTLPITDNPLVVQVSRDKLAHLGTCIGKLTHTGKFRLTIACLDLLAQHAKYKVTPMQPLQNLLSLGN